MMLKPDSSVLAVTDDTVCHHSQVERNETECIITCVECGQVVEDNSLGIDDVFAHQESGNEGSKEFHKGGQICYTEGNSMYYSNQVRLKRESESIAYIWQKIQNGVYYPHMLGHISVDDIASPQELFKMYCTHKKEVLDDKRQHRLVREDEPADPNRTSSLTEVIKWKLDALAKIKYPCSNSISNEHEPRATVERKPENTEVGTSEDSPQSSVILTELLESAPAKKQTQDLARVKPVKVKKDTSPLYDFDFNGLLGTDDPDILFQDDIDSQEMEPSKKSAPRFRVVKVPNSESIERNKLDEDLITLMSLHIMRQKDHLIKYDPDVAWMVKELESRKLLHFQQELLLELDQVKFALNPILPLSEQMRPMHRRCELAPFSTNLSRVQAYQASKGPNCEVVLASPMTMFIVSVVNGLKRSLAGEIWDVGTTEMTADTCRRINRRAFHVGRSVTPTGLDGPLPNFLSEDSPSEREQEQDIFLEGDLFGVNNEGGKKRVARNSSPKDKTRLEMLAQANLLFAMDMFKNMPSDILDILIDLVMALSVKIGHEIEHHNATNSIVPILYREDMIPGVQLFNSKFFGRAYAQDDAPDDSPDAFLCANNNMNSFWSWQHDAQNREEVMKSKWASKLRSSRTAMAVNYVMTALHIVLSPAIMVTRTLDGFFAFVFPGKSRHGPTINAYMKVLADSHRPLFIKKTPRSKTCYAVARWTKDFLSTQVVPTHGIEKDIPELRKLDIDVYLDPIDRFIKLYTYFKERNAPCIGLNDLINNVIPEEKTSKKRNRAQLEL